MISLLAAAAFGLCVGALAEDRAPLPVLDALPAAEALGPGWTRDISLLFDPISKPAEIVPSNTALPESFKKQKRDEVQDPKGRVSGWSHAHYDVRSSNGACRYETQVSRYRSQKILADAIDGLLKLDSKEYQTKTFKDVGEAAVVCRGRDGMTLWFRRGLFEVWISPMNRASTWEEDATFQRLARALDRQIETGGPANQPGPTSPQGRSKAP